MWGPRCCPHHGKAFRHPAGTSSMRSPPCSCHPAVWCRSGERQLPQPHPTKHTHTRHHGYRRSQAAMLSTDYCKNIARLWYFWIISGTSRAYLELLSNHIGFRVYTECVYVCLMFSCLHRRVGQVWLFYLLTMEWLLANNLEITLCRWWFGGLVSRISAATGPQFPNCWQRMLL